MEIRVKTYSILTILAVLAFSFIKLGFLDTGGGRDITEARKNEKTRTENIYWRERDNGCCRGARGKRFSEDLTVRVEKSNGENDLLSGEVRIKR